MLKLAASAKHEQLRNLNVSTAKLGIFVLKATTAKALSPLNTRVAVTILLNDDCMVPIWIGTLVRKQPDTGR